MPLGVATINKYINIFLKKKKKILFVENLPPDLPKGSKSPERGRWAPSEHLQESECEQMMLGFYHSWIEGPWTSPIS